MTQRKLWLTVNIFLFTLSPQTLRNKLAEIEGENRRMGVPEGETQVRGEGRLCLILMLIITPCFSTCKAQSVTDGANAVSVN